MQIRIVGYSSDLPLGPPSLTLMVEVGAGLDQGLHTEVVLHGQRWPQHVVLVLRGGGCQQQRRLALVVLSEKGFRRGAFVRAS